MASAMPVLDRGERVEELALHVQRDVLRPQALDADDGRFADRAEDVFVDHVSFYSRGSFTRKNTGVSP
jgi:hypothetical protein